MAVSERLDKTDWAALTGERLKRAPWLNMAADEAWNRANKILADKVLSAKLARYAGDPVGFGTKILGEYYTDDQKHIMESVLANRVTIAKSCNAVGKTHIAARIATWFYKVFPDAKVYLAAAPPLDNLRRVLWGELMTVVKRHPTLFVSDKIRSLSISRYTEEGIEEPSFITGVAIPLSGSASEREGKFSGKHAPHLLFVLDEGDAVPDEIYKGIESCMSGGFDRLLVMFNPKQQAGHMYHMERKGVGKVVPITAMNHPNVLTGKTIIPGAVDRDKVITRINEWTRPLAFDEKVDANCFLLPDFLVGTSCLAPNGQMYEPLPPGYRFVKEPEFWYMVLGEYPAQGEMQLIGRDWINNARSRWDAYVAAYGESPPDGVQPIMGLDVSEFGTDFNIACLRYGGYVARMIPWVGVDVDVTVNKALQIYVDHHVNIAMVDGTGVGAGVAPILARLGKERYPDADLRAVAVKVAERPSPLIKSDKGEFKIMRDQLWWAVREWLRTDPGAMLPPDADLMDELMTPTYSIPFGKIMVMKKDEMRDLLKRSPNRADSLCLSFAPFARPDVIRLMD